MSLALSRADESFSVFSFRALKRSSFSSCLSKISLALSKSACPLVIAFPMVQTSISVVGSDDLKGVVKAEGVVRTKDLKTLRHFLSGVSPLYPCSF